MQPRLTPDSAGPSWSSDQTRFGSAMDAYHSDFQFWLGIAIYVDLRGSPDTEYRSRLIATFAGLGLPPISD